MVLITNADHIYLGDWNAIYHSIIRTYNTSVTNGSPDTSTLNVVDVSVPPTTIRFGVSSQKGSENTAILTSPNNPITSPNHFPDIFDLQTAAGANSYVEWTNGDAGKKEISSIDVRNHDTVYVLITSAVPFGVHAYNGVLETLYASNTIDDLSVKNTYSTTVLQTSTGNNIESSTWKNYKSNTPSENTANDYNYDTDRFDFNLGQRFGLDSSHAQVNGSFFIDDRFGKIHFSSNVSGKTVILDT